MASPFDVHMAAVDAAVEAAFGDTLVTLIPKRMGNYSAGVDPLRPVRTFKAVVSISPNAGDLQGMNKSEGINPGRVTAVAPSTIWITAATAAGLGYEVKSGDEIELTARPGAPTYRVERPGFTDLGDLEMTVTLARGQTAP